MESGLLNAFHDDHFDGNYSKYDNMGLWSDGNDALGLQLTETLHGILPITPTEEEQYFGSEMVHRIPYRLNSECELQETIYNTDNEDFVIDHCTALDTLSESMSPSIEIIPVDPNCDFSSPITTEESDNETGSERSSSRCSQYSSDNSDSSSIGDYESHSSEDEEEEEDFKCEAEVNFTIKTEVKEVLNVNSRNEIKSKPKKKQFSAVIEPFYEPFSMNNIDIALNEPKLNLHLQDKPFVDQALEGEDFDTKLFDLASYITEDDYDLNISLNSVNEEAHIKPIVKRVLESKSKALDSDVEPIIDIETVHDNDKTVLMQNSTDYEAVDLNESFSHLEDDPVRDPSWSPNAKSTKAQKFQTKNKNRGLHKLSAKNKRFGAILQCTRLQNSQQAPNNKSIKSHVVLDRKKFGLGRGKNISMCSKPEIYDTDSEEESCSELEESTNVTQNCEVNQTSAITSNNNQCEERLKSALENDVKTISDVCSTDVLKSSTNEAINGETLPQAPPQIQEVVVPIKKKLNLEEYKRRRENQLIGDPNAKKQFRSPVKIIVSPLVKSDDPKKSDEVPKVQNKNISAQNQSKVKQRHNDNKFHDPILEAKNKVLRMQELKKAAHSRLIDSTVSSKVGPITPILPLEQITSMSCKNNTIDDKSLLKLNPDYEEIIIVSASCNTDITVPPNFKKLSSIPDSTPGPITAILKSSSLLSNISDTIKKASSSRDAVKISSNSLLSSIQDVVLKKSTTTTLNTGTQVSQRSPNIGISPPSQFSPQKPEMSQTDICNPSNEKSKEIEHGEDKIIMHLRKDRTRNKTLSIAIQTDTLPQFPPLSRILSENRSSGKDNLKRRKRQRNYRSHRSSSYSSDDDEYRSRSHLRYRSMSSQGTNRSTSSSHNSRYTRYIRDRRYSNSRRTVSPYRKTHVNSSRSSSRTKSRTDDTSSDSESSRRARSRERRNREYSTSHSSSDSSSRSRSRTSRSKTRSRSRSRFSSNISHSGRHDRHVSPGIKSVEERRIVYVGRIERETSKEDLKRKFSSYGPIKQITLHYKDTGMKYGFVTFERAQDAYQAIDNGMRDSKVNMYDISFGGRRAFCRASYSDLDGAATNSLQVLPYSSNNSRNLNEDDSFEALLQKVKEKLSSTKSTTSRVKT